MRNWRWMVMGAAVLLAGCGGEHNGRSALLDAAATGRTGAASREIAQMPGEIDQPDDEGRTALHLAVLNGHADVVEVLLKKGANPNVHDHAGQTPLHYAAIGGDVRSAQLLLAARADPSATDGTGKTAVELARMTGHRDVVAILQNAH